MFWSIVINGDSYFPNLDDERVAQLIKAELLARRVGNIEILPVREDTQIVSQVIKEVVGVPADRDLRNLNLKSVVWQ